MSRLGLARRESGQGTLEYILVLLIGIILILSLVYKFHDSFRIWANNFFDGYVKCLLEVGELPGAGSLCKDEYSAFDGNAGKGLLKNNLADGGGGSGKNGKGSSTANANKKSANRSGGEVTAPNGNSTVGRFGQDNGRNKVTNLGAVDKGDAGAATGKEPADGGATLGSFGRSFRPDRSRIEYGPGYVSEIDDEVKKGKPKTAAAGKSNDGSGLKPKSFTESIERKPATIVEINGNSLTFSGFIRMLFIICIIIAIVVFFGGQLMSIMKSREKGGDG